jgi:uncharacterized protein YkwD
MKKIILASMFLLSSLAIAETNSQPSIMGEDLTLVEFGRLVNVARTSAGLNALIITNELTCTAQTHALDIGEKRLCSVNPSDGSSPWDTAKKCGTSSYGMIIGCGYQNPNDTVQGWLGRQDTKDLLMNPAYKYMGVGMRNNFWTIFFGW